jgi:hypothetical protein
MSFLSNGGKFKLYTVLNGLLFSKPTKPRISFERAIVRIVYTRNVLDMDCQSQGRLKLMIELYISEICHKFQ